MIRTATAPEPLTLPEVTDRQLEAMRGKLLQADSTAQARIKLRMFRANCAYFASEVIRGPEEAPYRGRCLLGPHHVEWADALNQHSRILALAARDHGKSFFFVRAYALWMASVRAPGKEGYVISATDAQAKDHLRGIVEEVLGVGDNAPNPRLAHLLPLRKNTEREVVFANGTRLKARGFGSKIRGGHPWWAVGDDMLNDEHVWSETVRRKGIDYFLSAIEPMPVPGGQLVVVGCVTRDAWVKTEDGLRRIGGLCPGPHTPGTLYSYAGQVAGRVASRPVSGYWVQGEVETRRITLRGEFRVEGSGRHPLLAMGSDGAPEFRRSDEIKVGDWIALREGLGFGPASVGLCEFKERRPHHNRLDVPDVVTSDLAYLLGLWTAKGSFETTGRVAISNTEPEIQAWLGTAPFGMAFKPTGDGHTMRASSKAFLRLVEHLGGALTGCDGKIVPERIMGADEATIREFLRGLFDVDGSVDGENQQVMLGTTSEELARSVQLLLLHFGIVAYVDQRKPTKPTVRAPHPNHRLWTVRATGGDAHRYMTRIGFRLPRKQAELGRMRPVDPTRGIPGQGVLIAGMRCEKPRRRRSPDGVRLPMPVNAAAIAQSSRPSFARLNAVLAWFDANGGAGPAHEQLRANLAESDLVWMQVEAVDARTAFTVDFVVPGDHTFVSNGIVSHNTPFHAEDLYAQLARNGVYHVMKHAAVDAVTGKALWSARYNEVDLARKKRILANELRWSREFLCEPISDDSSLFPSWLFEQAGIKQPYSLGLDGRHWQAQGFRCFVGVDLALSASAKADWFVIFVVAVCPVSGDIWIVDILRRQGIGYQEQVDSIVSAAMSYDADLVFCEANQYQRVITDMVVRTSNVPIKAFYTTGSGGTKQATTKRRGMAGQYSANKNALDRGIPALRMLLENRKLRIPWAEDTRERVQLWLTEMNQYSFVEGKLQGVGAHDDTVLAFWMAERAAKMGGGFAVHFDAEDEAPADGSVPTPMGAIRRVDDGTVLPTPMNVAQEEDAPDWFGEAAKTAGLPGVRLPDDGRW